MNSNEIRQSFFKFFESKNHKIVPSAPMVLKDDPTLMFTNAGMNQFKEIFLGNKDITYHRVANTQKCLRVSGKHNDLEEVGYDTYHHTMFEMLGNWSFGDSKRPEEAYFKKEAIEWAWEYLTEVLKIDKTRLYATIFEGDKEDNTEADEESKSYWKKFLPDDHILYGSKKDNFWEMGETGPCGPCSEIHIDLRDDEEIKKIPGRDLINKDNPLVIEIWNLVFIQFNRLASGKLENLPQKHVDTGMGFERLCMVVQNKKSNYETDVFVPLINKIEDITGIRYRREDTSKHAELIRIAMRVIADHIRAVAFSIADGQLPSNTGAGYVIRRILRRAVRYGYQTLNMKEPFIFRLIPVLCHQMGETFPELIKQKRIIEEVIREEEAAFHKTLSVGLKLIDKICIDAINKKKLLIDGKKIFELYDTYGFPLDLTALIARDYGLRINEDEFYEELKKQKQRSRKATKIKPGDWTIVKKDDIEEFVGYDQLEANIYITKYREVNLNNKTLYQLVFNYTPFYAESGGQVGDTGYIESELEKINIIDTKLENNLIIHFAEELPQYPDLQFKAVVDKIRRERIACNHSATHLLHWALKKVLGEHVEQNGSLVHPDYLRFDFSHFQKMGSYEIKKVEKLVNAKIRDNIVVSEKRTIPIDEAKKMGAVALFGEKYGEIVRVIQFGESIEFCGGTHVKNTGNIGFFKIVTEGSIAAGIRRIEAVTAEKAEDYINSKLEIIDILKEKLKSADILKSIDHLLQENKLLTEKLETEQKKNLKIFKDELKNKITRKDNINIISSILEVDNPNIIKDLAFQLKSEVENMFLVIGAKVNDKAHLTIMISDNLVKEKNLHAGNIIREAAKLINGGGGGQAFYATAGGKNSDKLNEAINKALVAIL
ncbi:MAG: alanine--tRNA ligase [Marinilabiliales bacterium]